MLYIIFMLTEKPSKYIFKTNILISRVGLYHAMTPELHPMTHELHPMYPQWPPMTTELHPMTPIGGHWGSLRGIAIPLFQKPFVTNKHIFYKKTVYKKVGQNIMWYYNRFFCSIVNIYPWIISENNFQKYKMSATSSTVMVCVCVCGGGGGGVVEGIRYFLHHDL